MELSSTNRMHLLHKIHLCVDEMLKYGYIADESNLRILSEIIRRIQNEDVVFFSNCNDRKLIDSLGERYNRQRGWYDTYLSSKHWCNKRHEILSYYDNQCAICGSKDSLQVHHLTYDNVGNEQDGELVALCRSCHERTHNALDSLKSRMTEYNNKSETRLIQILNDEPNLIKEKFNEYLIFAHQIRCQEFYHAIGNNKTRHLAKLSIQFNRCGCRDELPPYSFINRLWDVVRPKKIEFLKQFKAYRLNKYTETQWSIH